MKRFMFLIILSLFLPTVYAANTCLTSSEFYAAEVVVPSYKITNFINYDQRIDSKYISRSQYSENLISIVSETSFPSGLSVRLQMPTVLREVKKPHIKIATSSIQGTPRTTQSRLFNGWSISCSTTSCLYEKDLMTVEAPFNDNAVVTIEINSELPTCSSACSGFCFAATTESKCIDARTKIDLDSLFAYANLSASFKDVFKDYIILGTEDISITDIAPLNSDLIDWEEAMKQELVYLDSINVITLPREDIEEITSLAEQGQAGQNYRTVYNLDSRNWGYYNTFADSVLTTDRDCSPYSLPQTSPENGQVNAFYLIPLFLTIVSVITLVILVIIARLINRSKHHKKI